MVTTMYYRTNSSRSQLNEKGFFSEETFLQAIVYALERVAMHAIRNNGELLKSGVLPSQDNPGDEADPLYFTAENPITDELNICIFTEEEFDERR
jgi:hypothetical protein